MQTNPHILVVDDNQDIRDLLARYLGKHGFRITTAKDGPSLLQELKCGAIDLVILDIMMPGEDGLSLCRRIRDMAGPPVILLTAMAEESDRIVGLELGADDYVVKPFNPRELLARVRAVLRRTEDVLQRHEKQENCQGWVFDRWHLRSKERTLLAKDGLETGLTSGEYQLLTVLLNRAGMVLSRDQLLDLCHGRAAQAFDRAIDNQISRLRRKIENDPANPVLIQTIWGNGYKFAGEVERV